MKKIKTVIALLLVISLVIPATACGSSADDDYDGEYKVAMITDAGDITDQSFNQTTYEACPICRVPRCCLWYSWALWFQV